MVPVVKLFSTKKGNTGSFSRIKMYILQSYRSLAVLAGMEKNENGHAKPTKSNAYKKNNNQIT